MAPYLVEQTNQAWTIQDIVFENVNIRTVDNSYDDESAIFGNIFMNGDNSSIMSDNGKRLYIGKNNRHLRIMTLISLFFFDRQ